MARYKCPSCGASYNGKVCRSCSYERFSEEIAHGLHTHEGEPLVVKTPEERPVSRTFPEASGKRPRPCNRKTRRSSRRFRIALVIFAVVVAFNFLVTFVHFAVDTVYSTNSLWDILEGVETEPEIQLPEDGTVLYDSGDILLVADWREGDSVENGFDVVLRNDSNRDITVSSQQIIANDYVLQHSYLYCQADSGDMDQSFFSLNETDLRNTQLPPAQDLRLTLELYDSESYETVATVENILLRAAEEDAATRHSQPEGTVLLDQDGILVRCLGYAPSDYAPEDFQEGTVLFYIENNTDRHLQCYMPEAQLEGEDVDMSLWCGLPAGTRAVTSVYLYYVDENGIRSTEDLKDVTFRLEFTDRDDYDYILLTDTFSLSEAID